MNTKMDEVRAVGLPTKCSNDAGRSGEIGSSPPLATINSKDSLEYFSGCLRRSLMSAWRIRRIVSGQVSILIKLAGEHERDHPLRASGMALRLFSRINYRPKDGNYA